MTAPHSDKVRGIGSAGSDRARELNVFLVVYELTDLVGDDDAEPAQRLLAAIESYPAHARLTRSAWLVRARGNAADLLDDLDRHLTRGDEIFVATLSGEAAWRNVACDYHHLAHALTGGETEEAAESG